jgi:hypothetical protein
LIGNIDTKHIFLARIEDLMGAGNMSSPCELFNSVDRTMIRDFITSDELARIMTIKGIF